MAAQFREQAGIPTEASELVVFHRRELTTTAARVDEGYPANTDPVLEEGRPVLKRRKGADRRPPALALEQTIHQCLPERSLHDILTRAAYLTGWGPPRAVRPALVIGPAAGGQDALWRVCWMKTTCGAAAGDPVIAGAGGCGFEAAPA
ncbi:hypothetical protein [Nonomuraea jabiensis]|uniref:hypothetical protein n=1 Tax=Nonomuraea jabiensis TaxID=882448 RepID=UPI0036811E40